MFVQQPAIHNNPFQKNNPFFIPHKFYSQQRNTPSLQQRYIRPSSPFHPTILNSYHTPKPAVFPQKYEIASSVNRGGKKAPENQEHGIKKRSINYKQNPFYRKNLLPPKTMNSSAAETNNSTSQYSQQSNKFYQPKTDNYLSKIDKYESNVDRYDFIVDKCEPKVDKYESRRDKYQPSVRKHYPTVENYQQRVENYQLKIDKQNGSRGSIQKIIIINSPKKRLPSEEIEVPKQKYLSSQLKIKLKSQTCLEAVSERDPITEQKGLRMPSVKDLPQKDLPLSVKLKGKIFYWNEVRIVY